jgi:hypothetical protein
LTSVGKELKHALPNMIPVNDLSPISVNKRKVAMVEMMKAVVKKNVDVDKMKKAIFNSYDFIDLRKDLVQKTIGLLV